MAMADVGKYAWRYQLGSAFLPAVPMTIGTSFSHSDLIHPLPELTLS